MLFAVFPAVKADLGLSDAELGLLGSAFIVVFLAVAPAAGLLGDRMRRLPLAAASVALWSLATVGSGLAASLGQLLAARSAVGVGESTYNPVCSALIADAYPPERRGSRLAVFNLAVPVGSAIGYVLGGFLGERFGWRTAFLAVGAPGLVLALACLLLEEPPRGRASDYAESTPRERSFLLDPVYGFTTAAMAALTFVLGALAAWMPTFLVRVHSLSIADASIRFGCLTALTGLAGTALGGWLGDRAVRRDPRGHLRVSAAGLLGAAPLTWIALASDDPLLFWTATALAEVLVFLNTGPLTAVIVERAGPAARATAVGTNLLLIHLFGDALSPWLVGWLSDRVGLRTALGIMPPVLVLSGVVCVIAGRRMGAPGPR